MKHNSFFIHMDQKLARLKELKAKREKMNSEIDKLEKEIREVIGDVIPPRVTECHSHTEKMFEKFRKDFFSFF